MAIGKQLKRRARLLLGLATLALPAHGGSEWEKGKWERTPAVISGSRHALPLTFRGSAEREKHDQFYEEYFATADTRLRDTYFPQPGVVHSRQSLIEQTLRVRIDEAIKQQFRKTPPGKTLEVIQQTVQGVNSIQVAAEPSTDGFLPTPELSLSYELVTDLAKVECRWGRFRAAYHQQWLLSSMAKLSQTPAQYRVEAAWQPIANGPSAHFQFDLGTSLIREELVQPLAPNLTASWLTQHSSDFKNNMTQHQLRLQWTLAF